MVQKAENANLRIKGKYETILDFTGTGVFEIDIKNRSGIISDTFKKIIASDNSSDALTVDQFLDCVSKQHRHEIHEALEKALIYKKPFLENFQISNRKEKILVKGQGEVHENGIYLLAIIPQEFQPDSIGSFLGADRYAEVFDFLPTPVLIISEDGSIRYVNKTLTEITGYQHSEIPALEQWIRKGFDDEADKVHEIISQLFNITSYHSEGEFKFKTKNNEIKYLHFYTAPLGKDEEGKKLIMSIAADVTENRKKDALLTQQTQELKILTDKLPHLLFTTDSDGKTEYLNERWLEFTGLSEAEMKDFGNSIIHPDDLSRLINQGEMYHGGSEAFDMDVRIKNYENKYRWLNIRAVPVKDAAGNVTRWIGTGTDVHDKYETEQKLLQKANEFISLVEMLDHHVWVMDANGTPEYFNKAWYKYTGLTEKETFEDRMAAVHPSHREKVKYQIESAWKKGVSYEVSLKLRRHDGEYQWFLSKGRPIRNAGGEIRKWIGTITNIHTHRQLEDALKHEVSVLSEIIESIPLMAWTADADGNIDYYNKRWYEYTSQSPDEAMGWGWKKIQHPEDIMRSMDAIMKSLKTGNGFEHEARFLRASDNSFRWHLIKVTPVKELSGVIKYWIGTATDIHEQKMLEQKKGQFLNIASHELRTPLTTLMGYLQLMEIAVEENNLSDVEKFLDKSSYSSQRMNRLINDLLNLSHVDSGKIAEFYKEKIDINQFIREVAEGYKQLHPERKFIVNTPPGISIVNANSFRLEQVLDNLLSNAIKYAPTSPIYVEVIQRSHEIQVSVKDNGKGIPEDKLKAIFDRFYRVRDNGTTSGLGIGLFISREIINEHKGDIWAESNGEGAKFCFTLPKA